MRLIEFFRDMFGTQETIYLTQKYESEKCKLAVEDFAVQMAINMIAGAIAKCEFKTYIKNQPVKKDEYYLWNVEPNVNQNSSEFLQEFISKLLYKNECLIVNVGGQYIIADSFTKDDAVLYPHTFTNVTRGTLTFDRAFTMSDVLYFKYSNKDIRTLLSNLMSGYSELLDMAVGKYKRSSGRKGVAKVSKTNSGDKDYQDKIDQFFNSRMKTYFENENAVAVIPSGVEYEEKPGEGSKKSTSDIVDIANITKEAMARVAQAFRIPPALLQGDIAEVEKLTDNFLTFCIAPLVDLIQTEINRKRYGKAAFTEGSFLRIDTTCIKHVDIFTIAEKADKLIATGLYSIDELREKLRDMPLNTWWSQEHWMTKNYSSLTATETTPEGGETK